MLGASVSLNAVSGKSIFGRVNTAAAAITTNNDAARSRDDIWKPQLVRTLCSGREIVNQNRGPSGNLLPKLRAANRATGASFVKPHLSRQYGTGRCTDGKVQAGLCSVLSLALFQEHSGLTTRRDDGFSEPEYQQLCLRVASVRRRFHLLQVVYGDHLR